MHTHTHSLTHSCAHTHMHSHTHALTLTHTHIHTYTHANTPRRLSMHTSSYTNLLMHPYLYTGWPLRTFTLMRQLPGHTKNHLDQAFGDMSHELYGTGNRGDATQDMLDWVQMHNLCKKVCPPPHTHTTHTYTHTTPLTPPPSPTLTSIQVFGPRLKAWEELKGTYDFDSFVFNYRPAAAQVRTLPRALTLPPTLPLTLTLGRTLTLTSAG